MAWPGGRAHHEFDQMISRVATSLPLLFDVSEVTPTSEPLPSPLVDPKYVSQLECSRPHAC